MNAEVPEEDTMVKSQISNLKPRSAGFTILELLVVVSIMAVIATLATGAVVKAVKQGRKKRVEATCRALEMALTNYRAQEGKWPFKLSDLKRQGTEGQSRNDKKYWAHGADNAKVFKDLYQGAGQKTVYLDASAVMALLDGQRVQLRAALSAGRRDVPLIYADPNETSILRYYCVEYRVETDTVAVHPHSDHSPCKDK
jgi:prepilin-type N-terminal cleavage/methylation domain-containing protein